jgi:hypothetical protein
LSFKGPTTTIINKDQSKNVVRDPYYEESGKLLVGIFFIITTGGVLSVAWIYMLSRMAAKLIDITFVVIIAVSIISGFSMLLGGLYLSGVCLLISAFFSMMFLFYLRPHLDFANANLKVACEAIKVNPATIIAAAAVLGVELLFCLIWIIAALGTATNESTIKVSSMGKIYPLSHCSTYQYDSVSL